MATFVWAPGANSNWSIGASWKVAGVSQANPPTAADDTLFGSGQGANNFNCTVTANSVCRSMIQTGYTGTLNGSGGVTIGDASGGAMTLAAGASYTGSWTTKFAATTDNSGAGWPIACLGKSLPGAVTINGVGGKWSLADNFTTASSITMTDGTLVDNGFAVTALSYAFNSGNTHALTATGTWHITSTATTTVLNFNSLGFTLTGSTMTVVIDNASANTRTISFGAKTFGTFTYTVAGSTGQLTLSTAGTFTTFNFSDATNARTLQVAAAQNLHFTNWNGSGTAGNLLTIQSGTASSAFTMTNDGSALVSADYLTVVDCTAAGTTPFYGGANSTGTRTTLWSFKAPPVGTVAGALGALTATVNGTPTVNGTVTGALGRLAVTATGTPTVNGTVTGALGRLAVTVAGVGSTPSAGGGNLTKPRHLGNAPGSKTLHGRGDFAWRLIITGVGDIEMAPALSLPVIEGGGELVTNDRRRLTRHAEGVGQVQTHYRHRVDVPRSGHGHATEDADDLFVLLTLGAP